MRTPSTEDWTRDLILAIVAGLALLGIAVGAWGQEQPISVWIDHVRVYQLFPTDGAPTPTTGRVHLSARVSMPLGTTVCITERDGAVIWWECEPPPGEVTP